MKAIVKKRILVPQIRKSGNIEVMLYKIENEKWNEYVMRSKTNILDKMLIHAQNIIWMSETDTELKDKYVIVEVELPGLRAMRCEGRVSNTSTILYPIPQPVTRIVFLKKESEELKPIHFLDFTGENWIYDSVVYGYELEYDAILVETPENKRIVLKEELLIPSKSKLVEKKTRKKKKRKIKKKKVPSKSKRMKSKKKRKRRRVRRSRKKKRGGRSK